MIALVETWLSPGVSSGELFDSRYQVFRHDRYPQSTDKSQGGGLTLAVKNDIQAVPLASLNVSNPHLESLCIKLKIHKQDVILALYYFPPPVKLETMESFAENICLKEELHENNFFLLGDFNIPNFYPPPNNTHSHSSSHTCDTHSTISDNQNQGPSCPENYESGVLTLLHGIIHFYDLESLNHVKNSNLRTLDLCLTNFNYNKISRKKVVHCYIERADGLVKIDDHHPPLILHIDTQKSQIPDILNSKHANTSFNFNKTNYELLNISLCKNDWQSVYDALTPDDKLNALYNELNKAFLCCTPLKSHNKNKQKFPKWWHKNTISINV